MSLHAGGWLSGDHEITLGSFNIIGKVLRKTSSWEIRGRRCGCRSAARKQERKWEWRLLWMNKTAGRKKPEAVCYLKSRSRSLCLCLIPSTLRCCVIRLLAERMINCHPQWWPSTAWMSTLSETSCLSEQHTQLEMLGHRRSCFDKHAQIHGQSSHFYALLSTHRRAQTRLDSSQRIPCARPQRFS